MTKYPNCINFEFNKINIASKIYSSMTFLNYIYLKHDY